MSRRGSVTVVFSFVFIVMFSFILSFFEMAAYTARRSYHASAALLATENYFAAYLKPLYENYHIFAREVPEGEDSVHWTERSIAEDVSYMTVKQEGEKSLLLRSGAQFQVEDVSVLTDNGLEGFYMQAVTAMKYRAVPEMVTMLKDFAGMTEKTDAHLELTAAKAATDSAYAEVDSKILHLMGLVDGVDITKYENYMTGVSETFQNEVYVKFFCTNPSTAAAYFDRTEVYQAFLNDYENPCDTLESMATRAETLADEMEKRIADEALYRGELARVRGQIAVVSSKIDELEERRKEAAMKYTAVATELEVLTEKAYDGEIKSVKELTAIKEELEEALKVIKQEREQQESIRDELKKQEAQIEKAQKELERKKEEQEKRAQKLADEEVAFVKRCKSIRDVCDEAYDYAEQIRLEVIKAKQEKGKCESVLSVLQPVLGEEAEEYRKELQKYSFYEQAEGYDFVQMKQTLLENKSCLWNVSEQITATDYITLRQAAEGLRRESQLVENYSFEGLRLDYGELSLEENLYEGVEGMISKEVASGLLGFFTEAEISEKSLDMSYLPSGFRYEEDGFDIFSLLGSDMSSVFTELRTLLPDGISVDTVADSVLFHSYLMTHFGDFSEENAEGALSYELEYLIAGKETDMENLLAVATRICALRTILHFVSLYTDSARKGAAEQAALAACGLIGLPALKSVITFLLLFVWALEEAVIDTAALLLGKNVLLYPGKTGGSLEFYEIVLFSKSFVFERAKQKADKKGIGMGYNEFLHLFVFLTSQDNKKYRAADLIQENIRKIYSDSFRVERCIWEISYETDGRSYEYAYE